jgi:hypothetical protein
VDLFLSYTRSKGENLSQKSGKKRTQSLPHHIKTSPYLHNKTIFQKFYCLVEKNMSLQKICIIRSAQHFIS